MFFCNTTRTTCLFLPRQLVQSNACGTVHGNMNLLIGHEVFFQTSLSRVSDHANNPETIVNALRACMFGTDAGPGRDNHGAVSVMWRGRVRRITPQHMGPPGPDTDPTQCMEQPLEVPPLYTNEDRFPPEYPAPKTTDDNTDSDVDIVAESADRESPTPLYELVAVPSLLPNYVAASPVSPVGETVAVGRAPQPMLQPVRGRRSFGSSNTARPPAWRTDNTENRQSVFADALSRLPPPRLPTTMQRAPLLNTVSRARRGALPIEFNRTRRRGSAPPRAILQSNWVGVGGREGTTVSRARRTSMPPTPPAMLPPVRAVGTSPSHES
eukprot:m.514942 g.514942  ORF g.514942 m.514942 type:complete len:325 (-) comp21915_c0_seq12:399-1373(-)